MFLPYTLQIIDISIGLSSNTVKFTSKEGLGSFRQLTRAIDDGDFFNGSELKDFSAHTGTHVDAPSHFINVMLLHLTESWLCLSASQYAQDLQPMQAGFAGSASNRGLEVLQEALHAGEGIELLSLETLNGKLYFACRNSTCQQWFWHGVLRQLQRLKQ